MSWDALDIENLHKEA